MKINSIKITTLDEQGNMIAKSESFPSQNSDEILLDMRLQEGSLEIVLERKDKERDLEIILERQDKERKE